MLRRALIWLVVIAVLLLVGAGIASLAQEQPKAPAVPDEPKVKVGVPDQPRVKAGVPEGARAAEKAARLEREMVDPRVQMASQFARSLASQPAIAVAGEHVYVVKGNTLYQFAVDGLRLLAKAELEPPEAERKARIEGVKPVKAERAAPAAAGVAK